MRRAGPVDAPQFQTGSAKRPSRSAARPADGSLTVGAYDQTGFGVFPNGPSHVRRAASGFPPTEPGAASPSLDTNATDPFRAIHEIRSTEPVNVESHRGYWIA
jgi:hypothetical protein